MYAAKDFKVATDVVKNIAKAQTAMGIELKCGDDDVIWIEVGTEHDLADLEADSDPAKNKPQYIKKRGLFQYAIEHADELDGDNLKKMKVLVVMIQYEDQHAELKRMLDAKGVVSQFVTFRKMRESTEKNNLSIFSNILGQINAKCGMDNYRLALSNKISSNNTETMVIGVNVIPLGR